MYSFVMLLLAIFNCLCIFNACLHTGPPCLSLLSEKARNSIRNARSRESFPSPPPLRGLHTLLLHFCDQCFLCDYSGIGRAEGFAWRAEGLRRFPPQSPTDISRVTSRNVGLSVWFLRRFPSLEDSSQRWCHETSLYLFQVFIGFSESPWVIPKVMSRNVVLSVWGLHRFPSLEDSSQGWHQETSVYLLEVFTGSP